MIVVQRLLGNESSSTFITFTCLERVYSVTRFGGFESSW